MDPDVDTISMLSLQLSELEMLQSMYPNTGELELDDSFAVSEMQQCVNGESEYERLQSRLGYTLKIDISDKGILEMVCHLPHEYPAVAPEVFLRSESLSRSRHRELSDNLQAYVQDLDRGEICMGSIIQWLQDNADSYMLKEDEHNPSKYEAENPSSQETVFTRMWIYSHHIYSKIKRKDILDFSAELKLSGFCMPGKPGMICIEGYSSNVEEFWQRVRRMQWKRLVMKEKEDIAITDERGVNSYRRFEGFEEKHFEPRQGKGRGAHMDRGLLFQFLEQKGCAHIFQFYFGVEGKTAEDSD